MITSRQNPKVKRIKSLRSRASARKAESAFIVEGIRLLEEARFAGKIPELVLFQPDLDARGQALIQAYHESGAECHLAAPEVLKAASATQHNQGIVGVFQIQSLPVPELLDLVLIADEVRDPGNLGSLMRSGLAAGADGLILTKGSVDPYSPKVVRAAMGAHFRLPILTASWKEITHITRGLQVYLADMKQGLALWEADLSNPLAIIIGSEAQGAGQQARMLADDLIHIPMSTHTESLNASTAGAVLLFEVMRQRLYPGT